METNARKVLDDLLEKREASELQELLFDCFTAAFIATQDRGERKELTGFHEDMYNFLNDVHEYQDRKLN